jgi:hypothetical protein
VTCLASQASAVHVAISRNVLADMMWASQANHGDAAIVPLTLGSVLFSMLTQRWASMSAELYSEILCWIALPMLLKRAGSRQDLASKGGLPGGPSGGKTTMISLWAVAACLAVASLFKAQVSVLITFLVRTDVPI